MRRAKPWLPIIAIVVAVLSMGLLGFCSIASRIDGVHVRIDAVVDKVTHIDVLAERVENIKNDVEEIKEDLKGRTFGGEIPIRNAIWGVLDL